MSASRKDENGDFRLLPGGAVQVANALAVNSAALVTHDRHFSHLRSLRVIL
jgi:predicted nucleic acid-binding protein